MASARAGLLLLSVWLFAAAWSGDRPVEPADSISSPCGPPESTSGLDLGPLVHRDPMLETRWASLGTGETMTNWSTSLPVGITPGTYLAVHSNGHTERVTIDVEFLHALGHDPDVTPQATHALTINGTSITLVRIASPAARLVIAEGPRASRRW